MTAQKQVLSSPALVTVALILLLAAATPLAHGQMLVVVNGQFCCTSSGNCPTGAAPIPGVAVNLNCTTGLGGGSVTVAQGITAANGTYSISSPNILTTTAGTVTGILTGNLPLPCILAADLPINETVCPLLGTATGILAAVPTFVNAVATPLGRVLSFNTTASVNLNL